MKSVWKTKLIDGRTSVDPTREESKGKGARNEEEFEKNDVLNGADRVG